MTLQQITVSLDLAQQLRDAGYPQESLFYWIDVLSGWELCTVNKAGNFQSLESNSFGIFHDQTRAYAAPTASELSEQLNIKKDGYGYWLVQPAEENGEKIWVCKYISVPPKAKGFVFYPVKSDSMVNALAGMYLYFKKQGLLTSPNQA